MISKKRLQERMSWRVGRHTHSLLGNKGETAYRAREIQAGALPRLYNVFLFGVYCYFLFSRTTKGSVD